MNKRINISDKLRFVLFAIIISSFILLPSTFAAAASWEPAELLTGHLKQNFPWEDIVVSDVKIIEKLPDEMPEKIIIEKGPLGRSVFSFIFRTGKRVVVRANVRALVSVVKSKRPFRRGHLMRMEDIYVSKMDIRKLPKSAVRNAENIAGKYLKRSVAANVSIVEDMIEGSKLVKRGKMVKLIININGLNISAAGKIKEKGYVGMPVRVINLSSKKEVRGVLVDENTVEVQL